MLTDVEVRKAKPQAKPYKLADFGSMYLLVKPNGARLWQYAFRLHGKGGTFSLGAYPAVSMAKAREECASARELVGKGLHPTQARNELKKQRKLAAEADILEASWQGWNAKISPMLAPRTRSRRETEIENNLPKALRKSPIASITRRDLVALLDPIDKRAPAVAQNVRQHLHGIFEYAINTGILASNPTPPASVLTSHPTSPHLALHGARLGDFLHQLQESKAIEQKSKTAMMLMILTVLRKVETTGAMWGELNLPGAEWHVPKSRMKERKEHWVPLSKQAVELMRQWQEAGHEESAFVFSNRRGGKRPMAGNTLNAILVRLGFGKEGTPHGMRSAFSTHFNRVSSKQQDVIERCLAHGPADEVRAAYNRYEYESERRAMLQQWADHVDQLRDAAAKRAAALLQT